MTVSECISEQDPTVDEGGEPERMTSAAQVEALSEELRQRKREGNLPEDYINPHKPVSLVLTKKGTLLSQEGKIYNLKGEFIRDISAF